MGGLLHLVQRGGDWAETQPAQASPRCTKCNIPSINQCTITVFLYNGPLLCGFIMPIKALILVGRRPAPSAVSAKLSTPVDREAVYDYAVICTERLAE